MKAPRLLLLAFLLLPSCSNDAGTTRIQFSDSGPKTGCQAKFSGGAADTAAPELPDMTDLPAIPPTTNAPPVGAEAIEPTIQSPPRTALRIESHDGFDRVVYEVVNSQCPAWRVQYVDEAVTYGHSDVLAVAGESILEVTVNGCGTGPDLVHDEDANVVTEIRRPWCSNIDPLANIPTTQLFIGVDSDRPAFTATVEPDRPPRLVIDIADR